VRRRHTAGYAGVQGDRGAREARGGGHAAVGGGTRVGCFLRFCSRVRWNLLESRGVSCFQSKGYSSLFRGYL